MWHSLVPIWTVILGLGIFIYVALDGFDLGVGMLHGVVEHQYRETLMNSIAPFWDGNETWLVLGSVGLLVYATFVSVASKAVTRSSPTAPSAWAEAHRRASQRLIPWVFSVAGIGLAAGLVLLILGR